MRVSPRRSPAWLACPPLLVLGLVACAPSSSLENLPPPCVSGYVACGSTGFCMKKSDDAEAELARERKCGYLNQEVRQGGTIVIDVPGATPDQLPTPTTDSPDLIATARADGARVVIDLQARHGAALGDVADHKVKIPAMIAGHLYPREFVVLVQAISASPKGSDENAGSESEPFRTFRKAASVAETGDTIVLRNDDFGRASEPNEKQEIVIPAGVTVRGQVPQHQVSNVQGAGPRAMDDGDAPTMATGQLVDQTLRTKLGMPLTLAGGATLDNLDIAHRLTITAEQVTVTVNDTSVAGGITVAKGANNATLSITGESRVITDDKTPNPVIVDADDATLAISGSTYIDHGPALAVAPVLMLSGRRQHLKIRDDARIQSINSPVAIQVVDAQTVEIDGRFDVAPRLRILGRVEIGGVDSMVTVMNASFALGVTGSGIVFKAGGESSSMRIEHSLFAGEGIVLDGGLHTKVTLRDTKFTDFSRNAIRVVAGHLDLGTKTESGDNRFKTNIETTTDPDAPIPVALQIDALAGEANVSSSGTTYDGFNPGRCDILGPTLKESVVRGFVKIANEIMIEFFP